MNEIWPQLDIKNCQKLIESVGIIVSVQGDEQLEASIIQISSAFVQIIEQITPEQV